MTRSTYWNKAERPEKKNKSFRTAWTHIRTPALKEVDLEPSAKRGANRTKALVSLYWWSQSLHPKESPNQISQKSPKIDPIRWCRTWKMSYRISKSYALQHIKTFFPQNTTSAHAHDGGCKWGSSQKIRLSQTPLLD